MEQDDADGGTGVPSGDSGFCRLADDTEGSIVGDESNGAIAVADDPRLLQALALIREVIADERRKTIDDMLKGANAPSATPAKTSQTGIASTAQRAPSGSSRTLCTRTLTDARERGLTTMRIKELANTEYEKMVSMSAIRNELATGEREDPPRYRQIGGVWYLPLYAPVLKVVG